jgi:hypothetical protein
MISHIAVSNLEPHSSPTTPDEQKQKLSLHTLLCVKHPAMMMTHGVHMPIAAVKRTRPPCRGDLF